MSALVLLLALATPPQDLPDWRVAFRNDLNMDGAKSRSIAAVAVTPDNGAIIAGSAILPKEATSDLVIRKLDVTGKQVWGVAVDSFGQKNSDTAVDVVVDRAGDGYVAVSTPIRNYDGFTLLKISGANGKVLWVKAVDTNNVRASAFDMDMDRDGNLILTGGYGSNAREEILTAKFAPNGNILWASRWKSPDGKTAQGKALAIGPDGDDYVAGFGTSKEGGEDGIALRIEGASGRLKWAQTIRGTALARDVANAIAVDRSGNALVTGSIYVQGSDNSPFVAKLNGADGSTAWQTNLTEPRGAWGAGVGVAALPDGTTLMGGHMLLTSPGRYDLVVSKFSADGKELWRAAMDSGAGRDDLSTAFRTDRYGNAYILGESAARNQLPAAFVARVNPDGKAAWAYLDPTPPSISNKPTALSVDSETGTLVAGGASVPSNNSEWMCFGIEQAPTALNATFNVLAGEALNLRTGKSEAGFQLGSVFGKATNLTVENPSTGALDASNLQFSAPKDFEGPVTFRYTLIRAGLKPSTGTVSIQVTKPKPPAAGNP